MAWSTPTTRATGDLISASIWNTDVVTNLNYLYGSRGTFVQASSGTRTNTSYGALSNGPDQVSSVVLPSAGLLFVVYRALWSCSVGGAGSAAIFLGSNQLQSWADTQSAPGAQAAYNGVSANTVAPLFTVAWGLASGVDSSSHATPVTTGQAASGIWSVNAAGSGSLLQGQGGVCVIEAAAGTYNVSVQFKSSSGTVTVTNRSLWVQAAAY